MTQESHCWAYTPRKPELKETNAPQCSSQPCLYDILKSGFKFTARLRGRCSSFPNVPCPHTCIDYMTIINTFHQFSSFAQSCLTLCDPMNRSTPGLPVHHQLPEFTQTHVHRVSDAIQPSHPGSSPSPPAPNRPQHQSLFL